MQQPVPPYAGMNQQNVIVVPNVISNREVWEESCWVIPPYANLFPGGEAGGTAIIPPPIQKTDLWAAMQTWPL